jgi:hypothetical protein
VDSNSNLGATLPRRIRHDDAVACRGQQGRGIDQIYALAILDTAGTAAALAVKCRNVRRGNFMANSSQVNIIPI